MPLPAAGPMAFGDRALLSVPPSLNTGVQIFALDAEGARALSVLFSAEIWWHCLRFDTGGPNAGSFPPSLLRDVGLG